jgi:4-alpha-glucanotransferase
MSLGLYGDVAVGVDPNGSEVWSNRHLYVDNVAVGAPPDPLALKGQNWGIPPQNPVELAAQAYQPFIRMLRANMQSAGALRIDHVMTLCRLWWVPRNFEATDGVYVHYPLDDLMKLVALESVRNRCLVIGEDLGTVPDAMRDAMERFALYHYKVLFFEKARDGQFIAPQDYPSRALAVVTTHDLPPFKSWWQSDDIVLREQLHQYPDQATRQQVQREREQDQRLLMQALVCAGLWHWQQHESVPAYSLALARAAYLYAGLSKAALLVVQPEDLLCMIEPVNVPGTSSEHANWQRKLTADLCDTLHQPEVQEIMQAMNKARRSENPNA